MQLNFQPNSRTTVAYASIDETHWDLGRLNFVKLQNYCEMRFHPIEIVSEVAHPTSNERPIWDLIIQRIARGEITLIILPSLFHVAGHRIAELSDFLGLLEIYQVKLISLKEKIDSDRFGRSQMLLLFASSSLSFNQTKGIS